MLNYGRFKLGAATVGSAQAAIGEAARYAAQRRQFGRPIASFGAIKHKLGEMTVRAYAIESMVFRTAGLIDGALEDHAAEDDDALLAALEEYAVESSILKVAGSEILNYVLDENIQIHGGNGYVKDYPAERHYRDSRVNRIFEGTNEINRLLIPGMLVRRAVRGQLPLIQAARELQDELLSPPPLASGGDGHLAPQAGAVRMFKKAGLAVLGLAMQTYGEKLTDEQELLSFTADILIDAYAAESMVHRARQAHDGGAGTAALQADAARAFVSDAAGRIDSAARSALAAMAEGDALRTHLAALRRLLKVPPVKHRRDSPAAGRSDRRAGRVYFLTTMPGMLPGRTGRIRAALAGAVLPAAVLAAACSPPPPDEAGYVDRLLEDRALKDEFFATGPDSAGPARPAVVDAARPLLRAGPRVPRPGPAHHSRRAAGVPGPDLDRPGARDAARGHARVQAQRRAAHAGGAGRAAGGGGDAALRPVPGRDERHGDLPGRTLPRPRPHAHGHLRPRLQPGVPSDLLLRRGVRTAPSRPPRIVSPPRCAPASGCPRRTSSGSPSGAARPPAPGSPNAGGGGQVARGPRCGGSSSTSTASWPTPSGCTWTPTGPCWPARA